ncbi:MAG: NTP transferase domain-containing protein [Rhizobiales bacterium]|nr:NTP transferase domain-containing protein [Hyphomicrobiales bacterium]
MKVGAPIRSAIVLSAGLGTRMRPLTDRMPKPLVPVLGRALVDRIIDRLAAAGIERVVVNVHYMADMLEAHVRGRSDVEVVISSERDELLDTGGGVAAALDLLGEGPFLIHNSDSLWFDGTGPTLARLAESWDGERMDTLLLVAPWALATGFDGRGDFFPEDGGRLRRRGTAERAPLIFAGVSVACRGLFESSGDAAIPQPGARVPFSLNRCWDRALAAGRLFGLEHDGRWFHVGDPQALDECARAIVAAGLDQPGRDGR